MVKNLWLFVQERMCGAEQEVGRVDFLEIVQIRKAPVYGFVICQTSYYSGRVYKRKYLVLEKKGYSWTDDLEEATVWYSKKEVQEFIDQENSLILEGWLFRLKIFFILLKIRFSLWKNKLREIG